MGALMVFPRAGRKQTGTGPAAGTMQNVTEHASEPHLSTAGLADPADARPRRSLRALRLRRGLALLLIFGLGAGNLAAGLAAGPFSQAGARAAGYGPYNLFVGALFIALGLLAAVARWSPAFWLAAALAAGDAFYTVVLVSRQQGAGDLGVRIAGLVLRLIVLVPLIAGGAGATRTLLRARPAETPTGETP